MLKQQSYPSQGTKRTDGNQCKQGGCFSLRLFCNRAQSKRLTPAPPCFTQKRPSNHTTNPRNPIRHHFQAETWDSTAANLGETDIAPLRGLGASSTDVHQPTNRRLKSMKVKMRLEVRLKEELHTKYCHASCVLSTTCKKTWALLDVRQRRTPLAGEAARTHTHTHNRQRTQQTTRPQHVCPSTARP